MAQRPSRMGALGTLLSDRQAASTEPDPDDAPDVDGQPDVDDREDRAAEGEQPLEGRASDSLLDAQPDPDADNDAGTEAATNAGTGGAADGAGAGSSAAATQPAQAEAGPSPTASRRHGSAVQHARRAAPTGTTGPGATDQQQDDGEAPQQRASERFRARTQALVKVSAEIPVEVDELLRNYLRSARDADDRPATRASVIASSLAALPDDVDELLDLLDDASVWLDAPAVKLLGGRIDPSVGDRLEHLLDRLADAGYDVTRRALLLAALRPALLQDVSVE